MVVEPDERAVRAIELGNQFTDSAIVGNRRAGQSIDSSERIRPISSVFVANVVKLGAISADICVNCTKYMARIIGENSNIDV